MKTKRWSYRCAIAAACLSASLALNAGRRGEAGPQETCRAFAARQTQPGAGATGL